MEKMTISEFGRYVCEQGFNIIILNSDNQHDDDLFESPQRLDLTFNIIKTTINPDVVYLQGASGSICFRYVNYITVDPNRTSLGVVVYVFCRNFGKGKTQLCYTLVCR